MSIVVIGLNHRTAPLDVLERVTLNGDARPRRCVDLRLATEHLRGRPALDLQPHRGLRGRRALPRRLRRHPRLLLRAGRAGARRAAAATSTASTTRTPSTHLFEVAAGLRLGGARRARDPRPGPQRVGAGPAGGHAARRRSTCSSATRSRSASGPAPRPAIGRATASVSHAAVEMATERLGVAGRSQGARVGAGEMGEGDRRRAGRPASASSSWPTAPPSGPPSWPPASAAGSCRSPTLADALADADVVLTSHRCRAAVIDRRPDRRRPWPAAPAGRCWSSTSPCPATSTRARRRARPASRCSTSTTSRDWAARGVASARRRGRARCGRSSAEEVERYVDDATARQAAPLVAQLHEPRRATCARPSWPASQRKLAELDDAQRAGRRGPHQGHRRQAAARPIGAAEGRRRHASGRAQRRARCATCSTCRERPAASRHPAHRHAGQRAGADAGRGRRGAAAGPPTPGSRSSWCSSRRPATAARTCRSTRSAARACS